METKISRRSFLKLAGMVFAGALLPVLPNPSKNEPSISKEFDKMGRQMMDGFVDGIRQGLNVGMDYGSGSDYSTYQLVVHNAQTNQNLILQTSYKPIRYQLHCVSDLHIGDVWKPR